MLSMANIIKQEYRNFHVILHIIRTRVIYWFRLRVRKFIGIFIFLFTFSKFIIFFCFVLFRISLDEGTFLKSFESSSSEINTLFFNKHLNVLASGGNDGILEVWDYRSRTKAHSKIINNG